MLHLRFRQVSDEDLAAFHKALDTETGRWGASAMRDALRTVIEPREHQLGQAS